MHVCVCVFCVVSVCVCESLCVSVLVSCGTVVERW